MEAANKDGVLEVLARLVKKYRPSLSLEDKKKLVLHYAPIATSASFSYAFQSSGAFLSTAEDFRKEFFSEIPAKQVKKILDLADKLSDELEKNWKIDPLHDHFNMPQFSVNKAYYSLSELRFYLMSNKMQSKRTAKNDSGDHRKVAKAELVEISLQIFEQVTGKKLKKSTTSKISEQRKIKSDYFPLLGAMFPNAEDYKKFADRYISAGRKSRQEATDIIQGFVP